MMKKFSNKYLYRLSKYFLKFATTDICKHCGKPAPMYSDVCDNCDKQIWTQKLKDKLFEEKTEQETQKTKDTDPFEILNKIKQEIIDKYSTSFKQSVLLAKDEFFYIRQDLQKYFEQYGGLNELYKKEEQVPDDILECVEIICGHLEKWCENILEFRKKSGHWYPFMLKNVDRFFPINTHISDYDVLNIDINTIFQIQMPMGFKPPIPPNYTNTIKTDMEAVCRIGGLNAAFFKLIDYKRDLREERTSLALLATEDSVYKAEIIARFMEHHLDNWERNFDFIFSSTIEKQVDAWVRKNPRNIRHLLITPFCKNEQDLLDLMSLHP